MATKKTKSAKSAKTAHTVTPAHHVTYAGFWKRAMAYIIDGFLLIVLVGFLNIGAWAGSAGMHQGGMDFGLRIIIGWLYFALMESSEKQATLGKMALGIMVTNMHGHRITFMRATGRHFAKYISGIILLIGFMMAGFTKKKQALHDMIADTLVVNGKK